MFDFLSGGNREWNRQLRTDYYDESFGVSADDRGNIYMAGGTTGNLDGPHAGGFHDAFVSKYDAAGNWQWTQQLGTDSQDAGFGVSADGLGIVYSSGWTTGSLGGPNIGERDAFLAKISDVIVPEPAGTLWLLMGMMAIFTYRRAAVS
jgi:Beta-propeller repeat